MNVVHTKKVDLNLLIVAECLFRHRNVSKAARELGLSQSAVSHALARLRDHYGDPLFVRVSKGVQPTEFAKSLHAELGELVEKANQISRKLEKFDPARARGRITIGSSDYFEIVVMPHLLPSLRKEAPNVQLSLRPLPGELPKPLLEDGTFDVAIAGYFEQIPEGFFAMKVFEDSFSIAFRKGHPLSRKKLSQELFYRHCEHALITLQGDFKDDSTAVIQGKKVSRQIIYGSHSFTGPAWVLTSSDLVLTGPTLLLKRYQEFFPLIVQPCPMDFEKLEMQMVWHSLSNRDPLKKWFRQKLKEVCQNLRA